MSRTSWYYDHDGHVAGPISVSELRHLAASGQLLPTDRVRKGDMDRWVKARAVKGLFAPPAAEAATGPAVTADPPDGDTVFDFLGAGPPPAAEAEPAPPAEFHPEFDFFGKSSPAPSAEVELHSPAPPPAPPKSAPPRKSKSARPSAERKPDPPPAPPEVPFAAESFPATPPASPDDGGSFRLTAPAATPPAESRDAAPVPFADFRADAPLAAPAGDDEVNFAADVPMASPASETGLVPPLTTAELAGPEVALQPDGTVQATGSMAELAVTGGWLTARAVAPDGSRREAHLRLGRLEAAALRDRPTAGGPALVLSFHAGGQVVAVLCEGDAEPARAFLRRVLEAAE